MKLDTDAMQSDAAASQRGFSESLYVVVIVAAVSLLVALSGSVYHWANWKRVTDSPCPAGNSVSYSFTMSHGFTCTAANGRSTSKWWWW
jgi:hypothetical protein